MAGSEIYILATGENRKLQDILQVITTVLSAVFVLLELIVVVRKKKYFMYVCNNGNYRTIPNNEERLGEKCINIGQLIPWYP